MRAIISTIKSTPGIMAHYSNKDEEHRKKEVYFSHVGPARQAAESQFGTNWIEYSRGRAAKSRSILKGASKLP